MSEFSPESEPTTSSGIPDKHEASESVVEDYSESNTVVSSKEQETSLYKHLWKKIKRVRRGNQGERIHIHCQQTGKVLPHCWSYSKSALNRKFPSIQVMH